MIILPVFEMFEAWKYSVGGTENSLRVVAPYFYVNCVTAKVLLN